MEVKAGENCLAHALGIAIEKVDKDPNYKAHIQGSKIRPVVQNLLEPTGIELSNGAVIPELVRLQEHFWENEIFVYQGPRCDNVMFEGQGDSSKPIKLLYDDVERNYQVIANLTVSMI